MEESAAAAGRVAIGLGMTEDEVAEEAVRRFFVLQECDDQKDIARLSDLAQKMRIFVRHAGFPDGDALVWKMVEAAWTTAETYDHFGSGYALTVLLHGSDLLSWCREELASGARRFYKWAGICGSEALTGFTRSLMWMAYAVDGIEYRDIGRFLALTEDLQLADKVRVLDLIRGDWTDTRMSPSRSCREPWPKRTRMPPVLSSTPSRRNRCCCAMPSCTCCFATPRSPASTCNPPWAPWEAPRNPLPRTSCLPNGSQPSPCSRILPGRTSRRSWLRTGSAVRRCGRRWPPPSRNGPVGGASRRRARGSWKSC
ncbi:hypothetical protein DFJ74DRAFT_652896 [Hyaloraphidium curvatum]|nr:hypothetical protein DFJ74DRAFT_652896 [Hyaloraphidium curvatum]